MSFNSLLIWLFAALLAAFVSLNWSAFMAPTTLSFLVAEVQAPLGLLMVGVVVGFAGLFASYLLVLQVSAFATMRRMSKDLIQQRELADKAEASRFTQLHAQMEQQVSGVKAQLDKTLQQMDERFAQMNEIHRQSLSESANSLSAHLGEVEEKMDRVLNRP